MSQRRVLDGTFTRFAERSYMGRFDGLVGGHYQPKHGRVGVTGWVGGGAQLEGYAITEGRILALPDEIQLEGTVTASASAELLAFAKLGKFALTRLESDFIYFRITKATATLELDRPVLGFGGLDRASQFDLSARLTFDVLALEFFGFVPLAHGGLSVFSTWATDEPPLTSLGPSGGLGIRHGGF